jgi:cephalosporin hydroxylase
MKSSSDFVRSLSYFLAEHTEHRAGYLSHLIETFMRGSNNLPSLEDQAKNEIKHRLSAEMGTQRNVPTFLQYYLLRRLSQEQWMPLATSLASRYVSRGSSKRFLSWEQRQQFVAELDREPIRGTELGLRQLLYSQGAGTVFSWRGFPCFKSVYDLALYSMLIDELHPATIIELGSGAGGSALFLADLCSSRGMATRILSIDNSPVEGISDARVDFILADCCDWLATTANAKSAFPRPCLMIEDFHGDLAGFFQNMDLILESGDYLVIEDSNPKQKRISQVISGRPYLIDSKYTDFFGTNCTSAINSIFVKRLDKSPVP